MNVVSIPDKQLRWTWLSMDPHPSLANITCCFLLWADGRRFSKFLPIRSENLSSFHKLLFRFFSSRLCCFLRGNFVYREAGILDQFDEVSVFVILTNNHLLDLIFQNYL